MNPRRRQAPFLARLPKIVLLVALVFAPACKPRLTPEQRALRTEARQALQAQSYARAAELGRQVVDFLPRENDAWEDLVEAQLGAGDLSAAAQSLGAWKAAIPQDSARRWESTGDLALAEVDSARALASWNKALDRRPHRVLQKLAQLHHVEKRWSQEEETLTRLLALDDAAANRVRRALVRRRLHRWPEALEDLRRARELEPQAEEVQKATALFERVGKFLSAIQDLTARLAITPGDDQLLTDRALLFLRSGDPEMALADSEAAGKLATWAMRPRLFGGLALIELGRAGEAEAAGIKGQTHLDALTPEFLETISRLDAEMSVERNNPELYVTRAWQLNDISQPALALQDAEAAVRFDANSAGAHAEMSYALAKLGRRDEAFEHIKKATELDANFSTAWQYRGELEMARDDCDAAVESLSRALAINQTPIALQKREECYIKLGQFEKAQADRRALEALR
ncbi:MAG: hypothetical protein ABIR71_14550 [Chthoniobacterales bacterium]